MTKDRKIVGIEISGWCMSALRVSNSVSSWKPPGESSRSRKLRCIMGEEFTADNSIHLAPGDPPVTVRPDALRYSFSRSSGPGGQSVNKLNTKAELRVAVSDLDGLSEPAERRLRTLAGQRLTADDELIIQSEATRSQVKNKADCLERLQALVLRAVTIPKKRKKTRPGKAARERRLKQKREQSEKKQRRREPPVS